MSSVSAREVSLLDSWERLRRAEEQEEGLWRELESSGDMKKTKVGAAVLKRNVEKLEEGLVEALEIAEKVNPKKKEFLNIWLEKIKLIKAARKLGLLRLKIFEGIKKKNLMTLKKFLAIAEGGRLPLSSEQVYFEELQRGVRGKLRWVSSFFGFYFPLPPALHQKIEKLKEGANNVFKRKDKPEKPGEDQQKRENEDLPQPNEDNSEERNTFSKKDGEQESNQQPSDGAPPKSNEGKEKEKPKLFVNFSKKDQKKDKEETNENEAAPPKEQKKDYMAPRLTVKQVDYLSKLGLSVPSGPSSVLPPSPLSEKDLKKAYKSKAREWHPDKVCDEDKEKAHQRFLEVKEAYDFLMATWPESRV